MSLFIKIFHIHSDTAKCRQNGATMRKPAYDQEEIRGDPAFAELTEKSSSTKGAAKQSNQKGGKQYVPGRHIRQGYIWWFWRVGVDLRNHQQNKSGRRFKNRKMLLTGSRLHIIVHNGQPHGPRTAIFRCRHILFLMLARHFVRRRHRLHTVCRCMVIRHLRCLVVAVNITMVICLLHAAALVMHLSLSRHPGTGMRSKWQHARAQYKQDQRARDKVI